MHVKYLLYWLTVSIIDVCSCQSDVVNNTVSRREIFEKQALEAYHTACFRLQELSNWMSVVFKLKSHWTSSTIHELEENSERPLDIDERKVPAIPKRPKTDESGCSLKNAQVTFRTYLHLQSQLLHLKSVLGRNMLRTGSARLGDANVSIRERLKMLDMFNDTLNDIFLKLRQGSQRLDFPVTSENTSPRNSGKNLEEQSNLMPNNIFKAREQKYLEPSQRRSKGFFQAVGKVIDNIVSRTLSSKKGHNSKEHAETNMKNEHTHLDASEDILNDNIIANDENSITHDNLDIIHHDIDITNDGR